MSHNREYLMGTKILVMVIKKQFTKVCTIRFPPFEGRHIETERTGRIYCKNFIMLFLRGKT